MANTQRVKQGWGKASRTAFRMAADIPAGQTLREWVNCEGVGFDGKTKQARDKQRKELHDERLAALKGYLRSEHVSVRVLAKFAIA